jgi:hypothetical protein
LTGVSDYYAHSLLPEIEMGWKLEGGGRDGETTQWKLGPRALYHNKHFLVVTPKTSHVESAIVGDFQRVPCHMPISNQQSAISNQHPRQPSGIVQVFPPSATRHLDWTRCFHYSGLIGRNPFDFFHVRTPPVSYLLRCGAVLSCTGILYPPDNWSFHLF